MKVISSIQFALFSPEQIRKMSAAKITVPDTYDDDGYPISGGLADQRLGVIDPGLKCKTCGGRMKTCSGHFGHIELVRPVIHTGFAKTIHQILRSTCRKCGRLMIHIPIAAAAGLKEIAPFPEVVETITREVPEAEVAELLEEGKAEGVAVVSARELHAAHAEAEKGEQQEDVVLSMPVSQSAVLDQARKITECPHCGELQKTMKLVKPTSFYEEDRRILPNEIRERLERIPDEDTKALGLAIRPEWAVLTVLPVPPVTVRPSITLETGERSEDDLTHKLVDVLRINQRLGENIDAGAPQLIIEDLWELLQYHIVTYFDNESAGIPPARHRSGRQLKTLVQRLKGKEGRFRYNLSGKRVNFSARTVVSPDPVLRVDELGVPEAIAHELTIPVRVTEWNLESVKELLRAKAEKINYVINAEGKRKKLTTSNLDEVLKEVVAGYVIERQLMDGDIVIFNRQPSLHRVSMMSHKIRVLPGKTFRFNVAACAPYNADFDGDEMNVHVPQNEEAMAEARVLMAVQNAILSPRHGNAIIGPTLDQITGIFLLTLPGIKFPKGDACAMLAAAGVEHEIDGDDIAGKELFSLFMPEHFNTEFTNRLGENVVVKNGKLASGTVDSKSNDIIIREIYLKHGSEAAQRYIDAVSRASVELVLRYGLSLTLNDYHLPKEALDEIEKIIRIGKSKVRALVRKYRARTLEREPGKTLLDTLEEKVMGVVEKVRRLCEKVTIHYIKRVHVDIGNEKLEHNSALFISKSGARGTRLNVTTMAGMLGQQAVRGKRIRTGYKGRVLTHFRRGDLTEEAHGFVASSYRHGLTPIEYFFHGAGGRDSVVDKGVNPAKTGYMQRRLINALQDFVVHEDASVRDASGNMVQFKYGDDAREVGGRPIAYGEPVGVVAAQSIGEPSTQMTLRTFHYAGVASLAQLGFTRLVEIVDARKSPKSPVMEIYLKPELAQNEEKVRDLAMRIEAVLLEDVADIKENFDRRVIKIIFDKQALKEAGMKESELAEKLAPHLAETTGIQHDVVKDAVGEGELTIRPKADNLKVIRKLTNSLRRIRLRGIPGISRAILIKKEEKQGKGGKEGKGKEEWVLATEGTNLEEVLKLPEIDATRTTTNDIVEISRTLGIEAGRNAIVVEITKVLDAQDLKVDYRHISLIADAITHRGEIKSIGRHGLAGEKTSVLARAAFEETAKHLINACVYGEEDNLKGITENIIIGQVIPVGTGRVKLVMKPS
jgi:DNA-directed RNA polymerase subunit A'